MQAAWTACLKKLSDADSVRGFFAEDDMLADSYLNSEAEKLERVSVSLKNAGRNYESMHNNSLSNIVRNGAKTFSVNEIYMRIYKCERQTASYNGISIGKNFKVKAGSVIISDYTKSTIKKYRKIEYDNEAEAAAHYTD